MFFSVYAKALVSFAMSVAIVVVQALTGAYSNGGSVSPLTWLGIAATLFAPAGLVAAFANTNFSPATKAIVQAVSAAVIVVVQGVVGSYGHLTNLTWLGILGTLLTTLGVYLVPNSGQQVVAGR